ncbi:hypothetical protein LINPERHAP2_LOCUS32282 [Linum perenne]
MFISGRGKEDDLAGEVEVPAVTNPKYKPWKINDNLVKIWLINSMQTAIRKNYVLHKTVKDICEGAQDAYSDTENATDLDIETLTHESQMRDNLWGR